MNKEQIECRDKARIQCILRDHMTDELAMQLADKILKMLASGDTDSDVESRCGECGGVGVVDSGGVTPDGNGIDVPCTCTPTVQAQDLFSRMKGKYWPIARALAKSEGWRMRIVAIDGQDCLNDPRFVSNRINVTVAQDHVSEYRGVG